MGRQPFKARYSFEILQACVGCTYIIAFYSQSGFSQWAEQSQNINLPKSKVALQDDLCHSIGTFVVPKGIVYSRYMDMRMGFASF